MQRSFTFADKLINTFDMFLRNVMHIESDISARIDPAAHVFDQNLNAAQKKQSIALMRVNHAGEVAAQALYHGQSLVARDANVAARMKESAGEEQEHLVWCRKRIKELNGQTSYLDPAWYAGAFVIGVLAGLAGDKWSLGFIAETENQVIEHLNKHLQLLPTNDEKSRAILIKMREDEALHGNMAIQCGGIELPSVVKTTMKWSSMVMTGVAYYL